MGADRPRPPIGREVRHWRRARGLTLGQVGERSQLNIGYLSQIENEKALPSLDALMAIAGALDVPAAWLMIDSSQPPRVVRATERPTVATSDAGGRVTEVDGGTSRDVRVLEVQGEPGRATGAHAHTGDEHHLVLSGRWRLTQGEETFELGPGDYLTWDASIPHDVENIGAEPGRLLLIYARNMRGKE
ncbi:MAG TPA: helix-turn-helix domain-containing protein [Candidatus Limnocylindrales bacterium]|nr:helix-turn-helix domain-containing protein [Candidatus Limnocylindrales bacterium]